MGPANFTNMLIAGDILKHQCAPTCCTKSNSTYQPGAPSHLLYKERVAAAAAGGRAAEDLRAAATKGGAPRRAEELLAAATTSGGAAKEALLAPAAATGGIPRRRRLATIGAAASLRLWSRKKSSLCELTQSLIWSSLQGQFRMAHGYCSSGSAKQ